MEKLGLGVTIHVPGQPPVKVCDPPVRRKDGRR
jgi:hypothetical protein